MLARIASRRKCTSVSWPAQTHRRNRAPLWLGVRAALGRLAGAESRLRPGVLGTIGAGRANCASKRRGRLLWSISRPRDVSDSRRARTDSRFRRKNLAVVARGGERAQVLQF